MFQLFADKSGFTLLELLVVLVIIGLFGAVIPGFLLRDNDTLALEHATRKMVEGLRSVQSAAIVKNRDQLFAIDVDDRKFLTSGSETSVQLTPEIDLRFITARQEQTSSSAGQIRFHPDGSSTGGRITLGLKGHRSVIDIDWLTGLISITDETGKRHDR